jgi:AcrR family transcriptional regulator
METRKKPGRRPRAERTQDICSAAKSAFAQFGYEGAIMADIARAAGIAEGTIYKMFASKRELLYTVMTDWYGSFTRELGRQLAGLDAPEQKLRYLIWHHLSIIEADPALCRVFFREVRVLDDYRGSPVFELNREYSAHVTRVVEEGVERGVFRDDVPVTMIRDAVFGGLEHYAWPFLAGERPLDVAGGTDAFCRLVLGGIARVPDTGGAETRLSRLVDRVEAAVARLEASPA